MLTITSAPLLGDNDRWFRRLVYDQSKKKARIKFRQPQSERTIARVYWYDDDEKCIWIDYYSAYGWKVCRELLDEEEKSVLRTIYDSKEREPLLPKLKYLLSPLSLLIL